MKPACTAPCDQRAMLELAIDAMVELPCPFTPGGPFAGDHVDFWDDECYAVAAPAPPDGVDWRPHCRACITEYLEEAVQPDPAVVVGGAGR